MYSDKDALLTSIIILTQNGFQHTKRCIQSISDHTEARYELICIDNGSSDGTSEYLKTLPNSTVIVNEINTGFPGGCNQGFSMAKGEYIVILNNDTVVTKKWLSKLIKWLEIDDKIGIVGPRSNFVLPEQMIHQVPYHTIDEMHIFADKWMEKNKEQGFTAPYLSGFCMAFKKELLLKIGGMDERFYPGYFEDIDFSIRARIAAKKLWVANDVYIHHHGSSSFKRLKQNKILNVNREKFLKKWRITNFDQLEELIKLEQPLNIERHYIPF
ncbi:glycosyltransferase family 2 protein [Cytobacillus firmus]|uniref:glycosyltransferase family 2 protein n=1 Tax=Cytobacillus firmus TaxID=1399 RepID=UPI0018CC923F|nr:glycosyltransferase family 2 protein [Cytobacillus firmus]MBG9588635.1 glycosyl transferase family 2 [Cytobacillus firmus]